MGIDVRFSDQVSRELADAGRPPLGSLATDALRAGLRARRRRRFGVFGSATAVTAVLVAAGLTFGGGLAPSASPVTPGAVQAGPETKPVTGQAVIALLTDLLPPGGTITEVEGYTTATGANGWFVYDDGQGAATISVGLATEPVDYGVPGMTCPVSEGGFTCQTQTTPDGAAMRIATMGPYTEDCTDTKCGIKDLRVEIARPGGLYVVADVYNGPFGGGRAPTRADTLLTVEQLIAIASDPRWGFQMDASFVDDAQTRVDPAAVSTEGAVPPGSAR